MNSQPVRIAPLNPAEFNEQQRAAVGEWGVLNFSCVLAHHPDLYRVFVPFLEKLVRFTELSPWDREVVVLRILSRCNETYEWGHHVDIARDKVAMSDQQIASVASDGALLSDFDRILMRAADELITDHCLDDTTWQQLSQQYTTLQLIELVGLVGCYTTMAMITKSFGIQPETKADVEQALSELRTYD